MDKFICSGLILLFKLLLLLNDSNALLITQSSLSSNAFIGTFNLSTVGARTFVSKRHEKTLVRYGGKWNNLKKCSLLKSNIYDDWRSDAVIDVLHLDLENVQQCLDEFIESDFGKQMFGCQELPSSYGITGSLGLIEVVGPEVVLVLDGKFWHRRETVLGHAALYLNARIPEINSVCVSDMEELKDFREIIDENTGEVLFLEDKRASDFNGDRYTMEYQGIDPDRRGPFPAGVGGLRPGGSMINPA